MQVEREPVIFVHGNGDAALHTQAPLATGWSRSIQYFLEQNYTTAELYATTWGDAWSDGSVLETYSTMHTCTQLMYLRKFFEAVLAYTKAKKVDVIAHSLGVMLARKVIKGGSLIATDGKCTFIILLPYPLHFVRQLFARSAAHIACRHLSGHCRCQLWSVRVPTRADGARLVQRARWSISGIYVRRPVTLRFY